MIKYSPSYFNIPHESFRKGQLETILFLRNADADIAIVEAPTGSGKSANGAGLARPYMNESVRVLTKTKSLQFQYEEYDFKVLLGLNNYD
jgi:Rad3-related DNA helicase